MSNLLTVYVSEASIEGSILPWWDNTLLYEDNKNTWIVALFSALDQQFEGE